MTLYRLLNLLRDMQSRDINECDDEVRHVTEWGDVPVKEVVYDAERKVVIIK